ncbi:MAG: sigma 54-interacting transcriptional regulator [Polyangiaceae bacterium]|nr:sigma 54-interacting transcriptional regulator [Polyangiaceae bacterium]
MNRYGAQASPDLSRGTRAGLVLLYAPSFDHFSPAYLLSERDLIIGRDPSSSICVPEGAVSRQHARIRFKDGQWLISDMGSRNGTLVDGQFITELPLEDLHEIRVGDAIFKFVAAGAESYARYRIDGRADGGGIENPTLTGIAGGFQIRMLLRALQRVAKSEISVVVLGESGTGKELFARELHAASNRRGAFQAVNCAAIPASLLESELFGYKRGAFSGADRDKAGIVKAADGGTLFLDEIGDMPLEAQAKLLRVLQSKEIIPVGATSPERVDVRIVCATHRNLAALQKDDRFRGDLFARLNEYSLVLPPLRERKEDIYGLTRNMLTRHGRAELPMTFSFMTGLLHYDWPFNVRELEAAIKRAVALADGPTLDAPHLPDPIKLAMAEYAVRTADGGLYQNGPTAVARYETQPHGYTGEDTSAVREAIRATTPSPLVPSHVGQAPPRQLRTGTPSEQELRALLAHHRGNVAAVGREFGKERMQVHRWLKRYGIDVEQYR